MATRWRSGPSSTADIQSALREEAATLVAALVRRLGDFDLAEEVSQDALVLALERWPGGGVPDNPGAWLRTVAHRRAIDVVRRRRRLSEKLALIASTAEPSAGREPDDRLRLIFTCCHPALGRDAQVALTLRAVAGLTTREIARALLSTEEAITQRIVRAKRKIVEARIPYEVPPPDRLPERLAHVLSVLYLMYNEGYLSASEQVAAKPETAADAEWLTSLLARLLPDQPEVRGLLALMRLHQARARARFDATGRLVLLEDQDRALWDREAIASAVALLETTLAEGRPGPFQIQAAIAACHCEAASWEATDWRQIVGLYTLLERTWPTAVVRLNRAIALRHVEGPEAALRDVEALRADLDGYHLFHATRAQLLRALGRESDAREADLEALRLASNPAERQLLEERVMIGT